MYIKWKCTNAYQVFASVIASNKKKQFFIVEKKNIYISPVMKMNNSTINSK